MSAIKQACALAALLTVAGTLVCAQEAKAPVADYPSKTITIVVTVQAGSQSDLFARLVAERLQNRLGKPVVVENRAGGGQTIGAAAAAKSIPDGYTLLQGNTSAMIISPQLRDPMPYVTPKDFEPITLMASGPSVLVVNPRLPIHTAEELVAYAKANPGKLNYGSHGAGSFTHAMTELFMGATGIDMVHVPYNGGGPLSIGFLSGSVDVVIFDLVAIRPHVESGKARVIAQVGSRRTAQYPSVPLISETITPNITADFWVGMAAPAGTPADVVARLDREISAIMTEPEVKAKAEAVSMAYVPGTPKSFSDLVAREWDLWGRVVRDRKIVVR
ncbi:MAG: tripartite tricarboxylate transporter substrate binding protein [Hyphomicrobiales bacterium]|nr:tripartite tricarboxylate transporter substrate binding protein [Hyphomicrobiales bacterium]